MSFILPIDLRNKLSRWKNKVDNVVAEIKWIRHELRELTQTLNELKRHIYIAQQASSDLQVVENVLKTIPTYVQAKDLYISNRSGLNLNVAIDGSVITITTSADALAFFTLYEVEVRNLAEDFDNRWREEISLLSKQGLITTVSGRVVVTEKGRKIAQHTSIFKKG